MYAHRNEVATDFALSTVRRNYPKNKMFLIESGSDMLAHLATRYECEYVHEPINLLAPKSNDIYAHFDNYEYMQKYREHLMYVCNNATTEWLLYLEPDVVIRNKITIFPRSSLGRIGGGGMKHNFNTYSQRMMDKINGLRKAGGFPELSDRRYGCAGGAMINRRALLDVLERDFIKEYDREIMYEDTYVSFNLLAGGYEIVDWQELVEPKHCKDEYRNVFASVVHQFKYFYNK